jgi:hypothetical protein
MLWMFIRKSARRLALLFCASLCHNLVVLSRRDSRARMGDGMRRVLLLGVAALLSVSVHSPAQAQPAPDVALVDALRREGPNTRAMLRDASEFCKDAVLPTSGKRDQTRCADKMVIAEDALTQQAAKDAWKELRSAEFSAVLGGMLSLQEGRATAGKAIPLFMNFLSALATAEKPAITTKKPGKKS